MRNEFSRKVRQAVFERAAGHCEKCTAPLQEGRFQYDHIKPCAFSGEATEDNCRLLCSNCHSTKTVKEDVPAISKSNRIRNRHIGIRKERHILAWRNFSGEIIRKGRSREKD